MNEAVRDCLVTGYEDLIASLSLPDPDGRHVLAAAIRGGADVIVTYNPSRLSGGNTGPIRHGGPASRRLSNSPSDLAPGVSAPPSNGNGRASRIPPRTAQELLAVWRFRVFLRLLPDSANSRTSCNHSHARFVAVPEGLHL